MRNAIFVSLILSLPGSVLGTEATWPDLSAPPKATGGGEQDSAVIVGVENYVFVPKVAGARQNAEAWHAYLTETLKVPFDRVALLEDNEATLEKIRKYAAQKAGEAQSGGTFWFIFIGHGAPSKEGKDGVLVGVDAQQDAEMLFARSLKRGELLAILNKGKQDKTVVLIDACFSGRTPEGEPLAKGLQPLLTVVDRPMGLDARTIMLTAAKSDQFAGALPKSQISRPAFSYLALGALRGWAADEQGRVTAGRVVEFARRALTLDKGRTQTPELAAGSADAMLGRGREGGPDLGRIDRKSAPPGRDFRVSDLPAVPQAEVPKALDSSEGFDFREVDMEALDAYNSVFEFDKTEALPEEKAERWKALAKANPKFADLAAKRAAAWEGYSAQKQAADEARAKRIESRDADWEKLGHMLSMGVVPAADKARWSVQFVKTYLQSPGIEPEAAAVLEPNLPTGPEKNKVAELARSAPVAPEPPKAAAASSGGKVPVVRSKPLVVPAYQGEALQCSGPGADKTFAPAPGTVALDQSDPAAALYRRGKGYYERKDWGSAIEEFRKVEKKYPKSGWVGESLLAIVYANLALEQFSLAEANLFLLGETYPDFLRRPDVNYVKGIVSLHKGDYAGAQQAFQRVPTDDARYYLGRSFILSKQPAQAASALASLVRDCPASVLREDAMLLLGDSYLLGGDFAGAQAKYRSFLEKYPESNLRAAALFRVGSAQFKARRFAEAMAAFQSVIERYPKDFFAPLAQYFIAEAHLASGQNREALFAYAKVIIQYPETIKISPLAHFKLAWTGYQLGDYPQAIQTCNNFLALYPHNARAKDVYLIMGNSLSKAGRNSEAAAAFKHVFDRAPTSEAAEQVLLALRGEAADDSLLLAVSPLTVAWNRRTHPEVLSAAGAP